MGQVTEGLWTYIIENGGTTIIGSTATGVVTIPSELGGYAVKKVGNGLPPIFGNPSTSVTSVTIPSSVTNIGDYAFAYGYGLTGTLTVPDSVTSIGDYAFSGCTSLTSITALSNVISIGEGAFYGCTASIILGLGGGGLSGGHVLIPAEPIIPQETTEGEWTYIVENGGATITATTATGAVTIPSELGGHAVKKVGNNVVPISGKFGNLNYYTTIGGGPNLGGPTLSIRFTDDDPNSYKNTSVTSVVIPNSVTSIGNYAFYNFSSLTSITIGTSVTSIGYQAFTNCTGLTTLTIPNSVTNIGYQAFTNCTGLTTLTIPNSVTSIGGSAFGGCTGLSTLTMPDRFTARLAEIGISGQVAFDYLVNALANNDAFVTAVVNKIKGTAGNYGIATQSGLSFAITTAIEPLATKTELTSSLAQSRTDGINSVLSNPNLWTLYTTTQIQNMAVGDLVLTRQVSGGFVLNYDIEQSTDLQNWTTYQALSLPLTGLPTDKAFVRIKAKQ
jgi:hypothetical protein